MTYFLSAFISLSVSVISFFIFPWLKRCTLTRSIEAYAEDNHGDGVRCRVFNKSFWTIRNAALYITLDVEKGDVISPPSGLRAFITPEQFAQLIDQQLCWAVCTSSGNPTYANIFAKERQPLSPCLISENYIAISSEAWPQIARVYLRRKSYSGEIQIISEDTDLRRFPIEINPDNLTCSIIFQ